MSGDLKDEMDGDMGGGLPPACAAVNDDLGELALGTLTGRERVAALAHLESCARCSAEVDELSAAADELLHLAPAAEPPLGFEAGVFERLGLQDKPRRWRPSFAWKFMLRPKVAAAIGACAVVLAFGLGALVGHRSGGGDYYNSAPVAPHSAVTEAALHTGNRMVGRVMVYAGNPTWLFMFMDDPSWQGTLRCEVVMDQGPTVMLGRFWLSDGKGAWAASVPQPAGRLAEARIVNDKGRVLAVADLS
jgi:Putative zinc-finger